MVESSDPYFPSIGSAVENTGSPDDGTGMQANLKWSHGSDEDHPIQEIQSLCMSCREQGTTRILLTSIPYFKEIIIMSFRCEHCGSSNNEVQPASTYREQGSTYTVKVLSRDDLDRQVVKSNTCFVTFPEFELTVPAGRGQLTTIEGILRDIVSDLSADQPLRRIEHEPAYTKIQTLIDGLSEIVADTDPETEKLSDSTRERLRKNRLQKSIRTFTIILDDPAGNSFLEFRGSTADPQWTVKTYNRTRRQNIDLGIAAPHDDARETTKTTDVPVNEEVSNEEVLIFPGSCSSCGKQIDTRMKKVNIPYFKDVIIMSTNCPHCGYKDNEVKSGGAISPQGKKITLKVENEEDIARDILKSETCGFAIPEIDLVLHEGTLGGRFTTLEGILQQIYDELNEKLLMGDSADGGESDKQKFAVFFANLRSVMAVERPFTVVLDDPLSNSYLQNIYALDEDPNMTVELYDRTFEQNEELGLNDIRVENYEEPVPEKPGAEVR